MDYYNRISRGYEELHREEQLKKIAAIKENIDIKSSDLLLDIGCGPYFGDFGCRVVGIDPSIELLKKARIPKVLGTAERLPFKDRIFDMIVSITAIQNFRDFKGALREIKRVGKGSFVLTYPKRSDNAELIRTLVEKEFKVIKMIEDEKDIILITKFKNKG